MSGVGGHGGRSQGTQDYVLQSLVSVFVFQKPGLNHGARCFAYNRRRVNVCCINVDQQIMGA